MVTCNNAAKRLISYMRYITLNKKGDQAGTGKSKPNTVTILAQQSRKIYRWCFTRVAYDINRGTLRVCFAKNAEIAEKNQRKIYALSAHFAAKNTG